MLDPDGKHGDIPCSNENKQRGKVRQIFRVLADAKIPILLMLGIISLLLGTIGFHRYFNLLGEEKSLATAFYDALWGFAIEPGNLIEPIPWELEAARWLSPAIAMYAILLGFAAIFRDQIRLLRLGFQRDHVIICGLGLKGLNIARNFRENGKEVVIIEKDGNNPNIAACRELGAVILNGDARDEYLLKKAGIMKARYLIGVCGEDGVNADVAVLARKLSAARKGSKLNCTIHIKNPHLWVLLRTQELSSAADNSFRLDIFNIYDQGSRQLFREFPLYESGSLQKAVPHLLIVGFSDFAEQLILNAARAWSAQYDAMRQKIIISIIDPLAEMVIGRLCQEYSLVENVCEWQSLAFDTDSIEFLKADYLFNKRKQPIVSTIYVMVDDENIGLSSALTLLERLRAYPVKILVRMNEEKGLASLIRESSKNTQAFDSLFLFGLMERTCKINLIYNSTHEAISRAMHEEYVRQEEKKGMLPGCSPSMQPWDCLAEEIREMNRTQADSIGAKLKAVRCDIAPWCDFRGEKFLFTAEEIELMAKMEHERWCAQKMAQGWTYGQVRDERNKVHPSLVSFDDSRLSETEKDKDRNTVRQIPLYLALAGYQIYRL